MERSPQLAMAKAFSKTVTFVLDIIATKHFMMAIGEMTIEFLFYGLYIEQEPMYRVGWHLLP
jgi:hypothetical protein